MIQIKTDNYGDIDFSTENPFDITTNAMVQGTPQISGWYFMDNADLSKYKHFFIIKDDNLFDDVLTNPSYITLYEGADKGTINSWIIYNAEEMRPGMMMPKVYWLYAFADATIAAQFKLLVS